MKVLPGFNIQELVRTFPMNESQWRTFPTMISNMLRHLGGISSWRAATADINEWNATDSVEMLLPMMRSDVRNMFAYYEDDNGPVALDPCFVARMYN